MVILMQSISYAGHARKQTPTLKLMNTRNFEKWSMGVALMVLTLASGCVQQASSSQESAAALINPSPDSDSVAQISSEEETDWADSSEPLSDAPAQPLSRENPLPPNVRSTGPLPELIKLAESGVEEAVLMAFVTNSASTFNLSSEEIIYLNDIG